MYKKITFVNTIECRPKREIESLTQMLLLKNHFSKKNLKKKIIILSLFTHPHGVPNPNEFIRRNLTKCCCFPYKYFQSLWGSKKMNYAFFGALQFPYSYYFMVYINKKRVVKNWGWVNIDRMFTSGCPSCSVCSCVLCLSACIIGCVSCAALCVAAVPVHDIKRLAWNSSGHCSELERAQSGPCATAHGLGSVMASASAAQCKCVG